MKSDTVLLLVLAVLGYVVIKKMSEPVTLPATPTSYATGGQLPAGSPDPVSAIAGAVQSVFNTIGAFAQTSPKTT